MVQGSEQGRRSNGVEFRATQRLRAIRCRLNVMLLVLTTVLLSPDDSPRVLPRRRDERWFDGSLLSKRADLLRFVALPNAERPRGTDAA